ncbi:MAG: hypothetical protein KAI17_27520 [Thiotrichaceae bacterium]|nr:hypothetical protein [Thiotrichaceae bacterium]
MAFILAQGSTLVVGAIIVEQITSLTPPSATATEEDITNMESTEIETRMGLADGGESSSEVVYDPVTMSGLIDLAEEHPKTLQNCVITLGEGGPTLSFSAYVKSFTLSASADKTWRGTLVLRRTATPVVPA